MATAPNRGRRLSPQDDRTPANAPKRASKAKSLTDEEGTLIQAIALILGDAPQSEIRFHPTRRWRFDYGWPLLRLAVELEGATFAGGRHTSGAGFQSDCTKYNTAAVMGWCVLRFTRAMLASGEALEVIVEAYRTRKAQVAA